MYLEVQWYLRVQLIQSGHKGRSKMKILILWSFQTSFIEASISELERLGCEVEVYFLKPTEQYPAYNIANTQTVRHFLNEIGYKVNSKGKNWDLVFCMGWHILPYSKFLLMNRNFLRIMYMDNQYLGKPKQKFLRLISKPVIRSLFDAAYVAGRLKAEFAKMIGFKESTIFTGGVAYDDRIFRCIPSEVSDERNIFVFVGRFAREKSILELLEGYGKYRDLSSLKIPLVLIGPSEDFTVQNADGIEVHSYLYPDDLILKLQKAKFFIFPSKHEPWGVALVEAAAAGCPLIASRFVGAADHILTEINGILLEEIDSDTICQALLESDDWNPGQIQIASQVSRNLAHKYSTGKWADRLLLIRELLLSNE